MSTVRIPNPGVLVPEAHRALVAAGEVVAGAGVDAGLLALTHLRASQINGCAAGVCAGAERSRHHGVTGEKVDTVAAWREAPWFTAAERAALALTEAVTRLADRPDPVPDHVWDQAATHFDQRELAVLLLNIAISNAFNRLDTPTRQPPGGH